jgi:hypothetical protein
MQMSGVPALDRQLLISRTLPLSYITVRVVFRNKVAANKQWYTMSLPKLRTPGPHQRRWYGSHLMTQQQTCAEDTFDSRVSAMFGKGHEAYNSITVLTSFTLLVAWPDNKAAYAKVSREINLLKTKPNLPYIWNQSVPRCKHFPPRL